MLQLKNNTPFTAAIALFPNEQGIETLYTVVKAAFSIYPQLSLAKQPAAINEKDDYFAKPGQSSLVKVSDYHTGKSATDILMTGSACAKDYQPVTQLPVSLRVANLQKNIVVMGDRVWQNGRPSAPKPFTEMPLIYERAFGGTVKREPGRPEQCDQRNPVGLGFCGDLSAADVEGWRLPNLEHSQHRLTRLGDQPEPVGFGPIAPYWLPRVNYAGTYDEVWQRKRAPYLPLDYSQRFMNCAPADQIYPGFLNGGEPVSIQGMHPMGDLQFLLPEVKLVQRIQLRNQEITAPFLLETVHLQPNQLQVTMVWRSSFMCDKRSLQIENIIVNMSR